MTNHLFTIILLRYYNDFGKIYRGGKINRTNHVPITDEKWDVYNHRVKFREMNEFALGF